MRKRHYCYYSQYTFVVCNQRLQTGANLVHTACKLQLLKRSCTLQRVHTDEQSRQT